MLSSIRGRGAGIASLSTGAGINGSQRAVIGGMRILTVAVLVVMMSDGTKVDAVDNEADMIFDVSRSY